MLKAHNAINNRQRKGRSFAEDETPVVIEGRGGGSRCLREKG